MENKFSPASDPTFVADFSGVDFLGRKKPLAKNVIIRKTIGFLVQFFSKITNQENERGIK